MVLSTELSRAKMEDRYSTAAEDESKSIAGAGKEHIYHGQKLGQERFATMTDMRRDTIAYGDGTEVASPLAMDRIGDSGSLKREMEDKMRITDGGKKRWGGGLEGENESGIH